MAIEPVAAAAGGVEAADDVHQRRFARAGGPHDGHVFVVADLEVNALEGIDLLLGTHVVGAPDVLKDDDIALGEGDGLGGIHFADHLNGHRYSWNYCPGSFPRGLPGWSKDRLVAS